MVMSSSVEVQIEQQHVDARLAVDAEEASLGAAFDERPHARLVEAARTRNARHLQQRVLPARCADRVRTPEAVTASAGTFFDPSSSTSAAMRSLRFVVRALVSFIVVPLPWQITSRSETVFLAQQVVWYLLVVLACAGLVAGIRRDALVTCLLGGLAVFGGAVIAINSGNIGSMVRFRDTTVPFIVWLSAVGATSRCPGLCRAAIVRTAMPADNAHRQSRSWKPHQ